MATVESIYQSRRDAQAKQLDERVAKIYLKHPSLREIHTKINLKNIEIIKAQLMSKDARQLLEVELLELHKQRDRYLSDYGISPDEFKLHYYCNLCQDRGFIVDKGHTKCPCMLKIQENLRRGQSHLSNKLDLENFSTFDANIFDDSEKHPDDSGLRMLTERENILEIKEQAWSFVRNFDDAQEKSMLFYGGVGLGKSFLCYCIAKELIGRNKRVLYLTVNELMDIMQLYSFDRALFFERYSLDDYYAVEQADLLILDDLGTEITNNFVKTVLFNIINSRMISKKKMLISTNLTPDELIVRYDERIASRIVEYMDFYMFFGKSKRW